MLNSTNRKICKFKNPRHIHIFVFHHKQSSFLPPYQTGNKEKYTSSHTKNFGEDPLGNKENKEKSKTERSTRHIYRGGALSMDEDLKSIKTALKARYNNKHKQVITEKKSILDESNLIEEDKQQ